jgi:hypothetical protein
VQRQAAVDIFTCNAPGQDAGERWDELDDRMRKTNCHIKSLISSITGL